MLVNFLEVSDLKLNMYQKKMEEPLDFSFGKYRGRPIFFAYFWNQKHDSCDSIDWILVIWILTLINILEDSIFFKVPSKLTLLEPEEQIKLWNGIIGFQIIWIPAWSNILEGSEVLYLEWST